MKLYVNWYEQEILTKEEFDKRIVKMIHNDEDFAEFLEGEYTPIEIFEMRDDSRLDFLEEFTDWAMKHTYIGDFQVVEFEIELPEGAILLIPAK
jgi:hypothetical protein